MHGRLHMFHELPETIRRAMLPVGLAVPRFRSLYYFWELIHAPETYCVTDAEVELFRHKLTEASELKWACCLVIALEADFRATGRVHQVSINIVELIIQLF